MATTISDIYAIVLAAGFGRRMQMKYPKQYFSIGNKTILEYSVETLLANSNINHVVIVLNPNDTHFVELTLAKHPRITIVNGGEKRANSVLAGIKAANKALWVLIHDASRPCLHQDDLVRLIAIRNTSSIGGILAVPVRDTIKYIDSNKKNITHTIDRANLWHALTPQFFPRNLFYNCLMHVLDKGIVTTDDASVLEYCGLYPTLIKGRSDNIKVTYLEDLKLVEFYLTNIL